MGEQKGFSLEELLSDIKRGRSDAALMAKYALTFNELREAMDELVELGKLSRSEVNARTKPAKETPPAPPQYWRIKAALYIGISCMSFGIMILALRGTRAVYSSYSSQDGDPVLFSFIGMVGIVTIVAIGVILHFRGCFYLAKGKGYDHAWCLLGLLLFVGPVVLAVLPDRISGRRVLTRKFAAGASILFAVALVCYGFYVLDQRSSCDKAALKVVRNLAFAMELFKNEWTDLGMLFDDETIERAVDGDVVRYMIGSYYGFDGTNFTCKVVVRIGRYEGKWVIEGVSLNGSHPKSWASRYVYRKQIGINSDVSVGVIENVADVGNRKSRDWNSYAYYDFHPSDRRPIVYADSIIQLEESLTIGKLVMKIPKGGSMWIELR